MKNKLKYCSICGRKNIQVPLMIQLLLSETYYQKHDEETGRPLLKEICGNLNCPKGCQENGGHVWRKWSGNWFTPNRTRKCIRCGDEESSGYY